MRGEPPEDAVLLRRDLTVLLSLQRFTATRDILLAAADARQLRGWLTACEGRLPGGTPGCVLVVADLMTDRPGEEALMVLREPSPRIRVDSAAICSGESPTALANC